MCLMRILVITTITWLTITVYMWHKWIGSVCLFYNPIMSIVNTCQQVCNNRNTTGVTIGAETAYSSRKSEFTPVFSGAHSLFFCVIFWRSLFFLCWSLYCLFFDLNRRWTHVLRNGIFGQYLLRVKIFGQRRTGSRIVCEFWYKHPVIKM